MGRSVAARSKQIAIMALKIRRCPGSKAHVGIVAARQQEGGVLAAAGKTGASQMLGSATRAGASQMLGSTTRAGASQIWGNVTRVGATRRPRGVVRVAVISGGSQSQQWGQHQTGAALRARGQPGAEAQTREPGAGVMTNGARHPPPTRQPRVVVMSGGRANKVGGAIKISINGASKMSGASLLRHRGVGRISGSSKAPRRELRGAVGWKRLLRPMGRGEMQAGEIMAVGARNQRAAIGSQRFSHNGQRRLPALPGQPAASGASPLRIRLTNGAGQLRAEKASGVCLLVVGVPAMLRQACQSQRHRRGKGRAGASLNRNSRPDHAAAHGVNNSSKLLRARSAASRSSPQPILTGLGQE